MAKTKLSTPHFTDFFALEGSDPFEDIELRNAIAQWLLSPLQNQLPQCGVFHDGGWELTRKPIPRDARTVVPLPQHLFMINWADTAPGISWPEDYYVTFAPGFNRMVVTASADSPDMWGVTDIAIGSYDPGETIECGAGRVIRAWWSAQRRNHDQEPWAYVWDEALIDRSIANQWRDEVWTPPEDELFDEFSED